MSESTSVDVDPDVPVGPSPDVGAAPSPAPAVFVPLPDGLDDMTPGPELGAVLAGVDRDACNGYQLVELLRARQRQISFLHAELLADTYALAYTYGGGPFEPPVRRIQRDEHVEEEVAFALSLTAYAAETQTGLAWASTVRVPEVLEALRAGRIDLPKVKVLLDEVELLDDDRARAVIARVLPDAGDDTTGKLRARMRKLVLAIDPDAVRKLHQKALDEREVRCIRHRDGTASIIGSGLSADKAAAAMDHISRIATATHKAGDPNGASTDGDARRTSQIRADVFVDLLDGADPTIPAAEGGAGALRPAPRKGVVNVTVELTTLMNLTEHPGELAGYGPVVADIARQVADGFRDVAVWRFSLTHNGRLLHEGRLHYRPTAEQKAYVQARDKHCQAPGCRRPSHQCDIDHVTAWQDHGTTIEDNLCNVCRRHHQPTHGACRVHCTQFVQVWVKPRRGAYPVSCGTVLHQTP